MVLIHLSPSSACFLANSVRYWTHAVFYWLLALMMNFGCLWLSSFYSTETMLLARAILAFMWVLFTHISFVFIGMLWEKILSLFSWNRKLILGLISDFDWKQIKLNFNDLLKNTYLNSDQESQSQWLCWKKELILL